MRKIHGMSVYSMGLRVNTHAYGARCAKLREAGDHDSQSGIQLYERSPRISGEDKEAAIQERIEAWCRGLERHSVPKDIHQTEDNEPAFV